MMNHQQTYTELYNLAQKYPIISLDIFDTLLLRSFAKADHLFYLLEHELILKFGQQMQGYKNKRIQAMRACKEKLAKTNDQEVTLKDVIQHIDILNEEQQQYALDLELALEEQHLTANKSFVEFVHHMRAQNRRIIYCSDTYFDNDFIIKILKRENIWKDGDKLYTSLSLQKNKADGDLFAEVLGLENLSADQLLHIGDNRRADYKMPKKHNIAAFWLRNPISQDWSKRYGFFNLQQDKRGAYKMGDLDIMPSISLGLNNCYHQQEHKGFLFDLGYHILAPLFLKICYDIKKLQDQQQNDIILFLARDGYILSKIYASLFEDQSRYFPASRRLLCLPSANYQEFKSIILGGPRGRNIQSYLNGFPAPQTLITALKQHFDHFDKAITNKEFSLFRQIIKDHWQDIKAVLEKEQQHLLSFLQQELADYRKIMIFDLGWKGSLLKKFQKFMPDKSWNGYYFATLKGAKKGLNIHSFALDYGNPEDRNALYFNNQELLELFFCEADEGFEKVTYDPKTQQYIAQRSQSFALIGNKPYLQQEYLQDGIFTFINDFKRQFSETQQQYLIAKIDPIAYLDRFIRNPEKHESRVFRHIYHYSITGSDYRIPFVQSGNLRKYRQSLWKQGSFNQSTRFCKAIIMLYEWQKQHFRKT